LIQTKEKLVVNCNSIDGILKSLDEILTKKSVITIQGIGQVALRRVLNYLEQRENNA